MQFLDLGKEYKTRFISLLECLESMQAKKHTDASLDALETRLAKTLQDLEVLMPMFWNTIARHILTHLCDFIRRCGPFKAHNMLCFERWHVTFKNLCRGRKNILVLALHTLNVM